MPIPKMCAPPPKLQFLSVQQLSERLDELFLRFSVAAESDAPMAPWPMAPTRCGHIATSAFSRQPQEAISDACAESETAWTEEEDEQLKRLFERIGPQWVRIVGEWRPVDGVHRKMSQIRNRAMRLTISPGEGPDL
jgi:hypothetical protein